MKPPSRLRPPPAYQEYASDILAKEAYLLMGGTERGVFWSIRLRCWVDGSVPADSEELARILGLELSEVEEGMTPNVKKFLDQHPQQSGRWIVPDLEDYRAYLLARHQKQSEGGSRGGRTSASKRSSQPQGHLIGSEMRRDDLKRNEASREDLSEEHLEWVRDYDSAPNGE